MCSPATCPALRLAHGCCAQRWAEWLLLLGCGALSHAGCWLEMLAMLLLSTEASRRGQGGCSQAQMIDKSMRLCLRAGQAESVCHAAAAGRRQDALGQEARTAGALRRNRCCPAISPMSDPAVFALTCSICAELAHRAWQGPRLRGLKPVCRSSRQACSHARAAACAGGPTQMEGPVRHCQGAVPHSL